MRSCRTCRFLAVMPNAAGKRVPRKGNTYCCNVTVPDVLLPDCITKAYKYSWPPPRTRVEPDDGAACPFYRTNN